MPDLKDPVPVSPHFIAWLDAERGRAEFFTKMDPSLPQSLIAKIKAGRRPIRWTLALRLAIAQKPSDDPIDARDLCTYLEDRVMLDAMVRWLKHNYKTPS